MLILFVLSLVGIFIGWVIKAIFTCNGLNYSGASSFALISWVIILIVLKIYTDINFYNEYSNGIYAFFMALGVFWGVLASEDNSKDNS